MSDVKFICPRCQQTMVSDEIHGGTTIACPSCSNLISIPRTQKGPLNRQNLTIVAVAFAAIAFISWLAGYNLYHNPSDQEIYCEKQYGDLLQSNEEVDSIRNALIKICQEHQFDNDYETREQARLNLKQANAEEIEELNEEHASYLKITDAKAERFAERHKYNLAAEILMAIAFAFWLLLFITNPTHTIRA